MADTIKKLPFPNWLLKTDCIITLNANGVGRNGEPIGQITYEGKCIFSEKVKRVIDADGKKIQLMGKVIVKGDIATSAIYPDNYLNPGELVFPIDRPNISDGTIFIDGHTYEIHTGYRPRNPDGSIHHTEFEVK